jgi:hypothetical protein
VRKKERERPRWREGERKKIEGEKKRERGALLSSMSQWVASSFETGWLSRQCLCSLCGNKSHCRPTPLASSPGQSNPLYSLLRRKHSITGNRQLYSNKLQIFFF